MCGEGGGGSTDAGGRGRGRRKDWVSLGFIRSAPQLLHALAGLTTDQSKREVVIRADRVIGCDSSIRLSIEGTRIGPVGLATRAARRIRLGAGRQRGGRPGTR